MPQAHAHVGTRECKYNRRVHIRARNPITSRACTGVFLLGSLEQEMANKKLCVVEWTDPPHTGKRHTVENRCVVLGKCEPGSAVKVKLGKSSSAKKWNKFILAPYKRWRLLRRVMLRRQHRVLLGRQHRVLLSRPYL